MLLKPSDIYKTAEDIVNFVNSDASDADKKTILTMVRDFYTDRNEHVVDQWFASLAQRTIDKHYPPTGLENE